MSPSPSSEKSPEAAKTKASENEEPGPAFSTKALTAAVVAWLVPGGGHFFLKRHARGAGFLVLVLLALVVGCMLHGRLPWQWGGSPLRVLATLGSMGTGVAYFVLRFVLHYEGDLRAAGFEYGSAFILTAGLMNLLLVLDAWDIALGRKE